ncbi:FHA domain-containing protein [Pseudoclavibacter endophyticus]|uniref:FHA domain-containing protein n=2 Tax=Pseudoclavibacter endophyticus TaxID=1778590 RepID=A0A6H9WVE2_9MICO|nr:FHA domain-containing protein [Pseudoclavibacter endophyticus]
MHPAQAAGHPEQSVARPFAAPGGAPDPAGDAAPNAARATAAAQEAPAPAPPVAPPYAAPSQQAPPQPYAQPVVRAPANHSYPGYAAQQPPTLQPPLAQPHTGVAAPGQYVSPSQAVDHAAVSVLPPNGGHAPTLHAAGEGAAPSVFQYRPATAETGSEAADEEGEDELVSYDFLFGGTEQINEVLAELAEAREAARGDEPDDAGDAAAAAGAPVNAVEAAARPPLHDAAIVHTPPDSPRVGSPSAPAQPDIDSTVIGGQAHELRRQAQTVQPNEGPRTGLRPASVANVPDAHPGDHGGDTLFGGAAQQLRAENAGRHHQAASAPSPQPPAAASPSAAAAPPFAAPPAEDSFVVDFGSSGEVAAIGPVVIGRAPSATAERAGDTSPQLVTIDGVKDISRNHVRIELSGGVTVVTDLHSRNGTEVVMPGRPRQRLRPGEPTAVVPGTVIDLGSGIAFTVRR